jgi:hypothetical protein
MSFPPGTEMFQFPGFASPAYEFSERSPSRGGLPHSDIHGSTPARGSPWLFAACHVLHRLLVPRHPPNALLMLEIRQHPPARSPPRKDAANPPCTGTSHARITASRHGPPSRPALPPRRPATRQARTQHTHGTASERPLRIPPYGPNAAERSRQGRLAATPPQGARAPVRHRDLSTSSDAPEPDSP